MDGRNNYWLETRLETLWQEYFADVERKNNVVIFFGRRARNRLGSIRLDPATGDTQIRVTALFRDLEVPEMVVEATIAHEIVHYVHGFCSPLPQNFRYPHQGGIIKQELAKRGLLDLFQESKVWLKENWVDFTRKKYPPPRSRRPGRGRRRRFRLILGY